ncbi:FRG domain-containing protein [Frateuria sp. STR12]|uniref:FRG domain-containing protein n=1 Tax=Frateuria hangzhouensis TaxID=2995589 RepID=UPI0022609440|nr:FRG domain-containing protein [Frateuria sp. STR12]MCX7515400.1 FRG domain-containing protein [Frateuria sp. STR12]
MKEILWTDLPTFLSEIASLEGVAPGDTLLFRGQPCSKPLLPKIARVHPERDSTQVERAMLAELRRQGCRFSGVGASSDLDLLAIAQHHGMATRLLDWSTSPLVALWFACLEYWTAESAHLYIYRAAQDVLLDPSTDADPFAFAVTKVFRPAHNNARLVSQDGWFSIHPYYAGMSFKALDSDVIHFLWVYHLEIPHEQKSFILKKLDLLGINYRSMLPDLDGLCKYVNWRMTS